MTLTVKNIRSIAQLYYNLDMFTEDVPIEIIQITIYRLLYNLTPSPPKKLLLVTLLDKISRSCQRGMVRKKEKTSNQTSSMIKRCLVMPLTLLLF